jgi:hypothetical protein
MPSYKKRGIQDKPPYLILHKESPILRTSHSVAGVFENIGSKCKMMYPFKISVQTGIQKTEESDFLPAYPRYATVSLLKNRNLAIHTIEEARFLILIWFNLSGHHIPHVEIARQSSMYF